MKNYKEFAQTIENDYIRATYVKVMEIIANVRLVAKRIELLTDAGYTVKELPMGSGGVGQLQELSQAFRIQIGYGKGKHNYAATVEVQKETLVQFPLPRTVFAGFYHSYESDIIDSYYYETDEEGEPTENTIQDINHLSVAYSILLTQFIAQFDLPLKLSELRFSELCSPKFYNFKTDDIWCTFPLSKLDAIHLYMVSNEERLTAFKEAIKTNHKTRSGFISFISTQLDEWVNQNVTEWTLNSDRYYHKISTLLQSYFNHCVDNLGIDDFPLAGHKDQYYILSDDVVKDNLWDAESIVSDYLSSTAYLHRTPLK